MIRINCLEILFYKLDVLLIVSQNFFFNPLSPSDAGRKQKRNILEDRFSPVLPQLKKYHPSGNLKFNNLDIFQSLKSRILVGKKSFKKSKISLQILWAVMMLFRSLKLPSDIMNLNVSISFKNSYKT